MKRLITLPWLIFSFSLISNAQWVQTNGPYGASVQAISASSTGVFLGTQGGGVFRSTDNGTSWTDVNTGLSDLALNVQCFADDGSTLYAGTFIGIFRTTNSGASWMFASTGLSSHNVYALTASGTSIYAGIYLGGVYRSTDNGTTWVNTNLAATNVTSLASIGTNLFAGTDGNGVYRSTDSGSSWIAVDSGLTNLRIQAMASSGSNIFVGTYGGGVFISSDSARSWTGANNGLSSYYIQSFGTGDPGIFVATNLGVFLSTNNGTNWTNAGNGLMGRIRVFAIGGSTIFAGGPRGIFLSTDNGSSWAVSNTGLKNALVHSVIVSGGNLLAGVEASGLFLSADNGTTWTSVGSSPNTPFTPMCFAEAGPNLYMGGNDMLVSTNHGTSWTRINNGITGGINALALDGSNIIAGTDPYGIFLSTDNGTNWTATNSGLPHMHVRSVAAHGTKWLAGLGYNGIYVSTDNGSSWGAVDGTSGIDVNAFSAVGTNLFAGASGGVYRSTDDGLTWTAVNSGLSTAGGYVSSFAVSGTNLFAGTYPFGIFLSSDNGSSWIPVNNGLTAAGLPVSSLTIGGTSIYAGTNAGVFAARLESIIPPHPPQNLTVTDSSGGTITIKWNKNSEADFLLYRIYLSDVPGMATIVDSTGGRADTSKTFSGLNNGTRYYFRVTAVDSAGNQSGYSNEVNATPSEIPKITSFEPILGPLGTIVTISGTGFSPIPADNIVSFGGVQSFVSAASSTSLTVVAPASSGLARVSVTADGLTAFGNGGFLTTFGGGGVVGTKSLAPKTDFPTLQRPYNIAAGDLDGDGKIDLAVVHMSYDAYSSDSVSIFRNTSLSGTISSNSFALRLDIGTGWRPRAIAINDLDGDGKPELTITNSSSNTISILRNSSSAGNISFEPKVDFSTGTIPSGIAVGDIDGDGRPDIVATSVVDSTISVFRNVSAPGNISAGSFLPSVTIRTDASSVYLLVEDLNGDGKADVAVTNNNGNSVSILRNTATPGIVSAGSFAPRVDMPTGDSPQIIVAGDLDGDGKTDLVTANNGANTVSVFRNTSAGDTVVANWFAPKVDYSIGPFPSYAPFGVAGGDIDGDGKPDLVVSNFGASLASNLTVLRNTSAIGSMTSSSFSSRTDFVTGTGPTGVAVTDLDGDGRVDIAAINSMSHSISVLRNVSLVPSFSSGSFSFGRIRNGDYRDTTVTITNNGIDTLTFSAISSGSASFSARPGTKILPPQQSFTDTLRFAPLSAGTIASAYLVVSNASSSPDTIRVDGFGAIYSVNLSWKSASFGSVPVGQTKDTTVVVTNTGNDSLQVTNIVVSNPRFTTKRTSFSLAPSESIEDTIRFSPQTAGPDTAIVLIYSNVSSVPDTIVVTGVGSPVTGIEAWLTEIPQEYSLHQNYPNPFNPSTVIRYGLPERSRVKLEIYDLLGRVIETLVDQEQDARFFEVHWHATVPSGIYFYRIVATAVSDPAKHLTQVRKMILLR